MKKLLLFLAMLFPSVLFAQGSQFQSILLGPTGRPAAGAVITVCAFGSTGIPCQSPINLFSDPGLSIPMTNPTKSDSLGNWGFWALPNNYVYTVTGVGITANGPFVISVPCNLNSSCSGTTSTFAGLPVSPVTNALAIITDGNGNNCLGGGGTVRELCQWTGTAWILISAPVTASFPITAAQGGTGNVTLPAHSVLLGEGINPVAAATPNSNAQCLMTAPSNFATTDPSFQTCPSGGGGGSPSAGAQGVIQGAGSVAGTFQVSNLSETANVLTIAEDVITQGPNLGVDIRKLGARPVNGASVPATTATITSGMNALVVASGTGFQKNDGIALVGGGATNCGTPPAAPTVTPSLAASMTGTGFSVPGATGSTSMSYTVIGHGKFGCTTAASPVTTISNASNALGSNTLAITSCSNSLGTTTCVVGSTANLANGTYGSIHGTNNPQEFDGDFQITVVDGTHFSLQSNISSLYGMFSTTSSGGTFYYWPENHIVLPALPAGTNMLNEAVYRCIGASCALPANAANYSLVYISYPLTGFNNSAADATYGTWDDYGTTMTPALVLNQSAPWYIPATPPATNVNDMLVTTVTNIVGTAFTLAANAVNTVGASSCNGGACSLRFDDAPAIAAAIAASNTFSAGGGGAVHIPPIVEDGTGQLCYQTSSYLTISGIVNQGGPFCAGDTVEQSNGSTWNGTYEDSIRTSLGGGNGIQKLITFLSHGANPTLLRKNSTIRNITLATSGPGSLGVFDTSGNATTTENVNFVTDQAANDYMGIAYYFYNDDSGTGLFGGTFNNTCWLSGPVQTVGSTNTPIFISKNGGEWHFNYFCGHTRGFYFSTNNSNAAAAFFITMKMGEEIQGPITPLFTFNSCCGGNRGGMIYLEHLIGDSGSEAMISNASVGGSMGAPIFINGINGGQSSAPIITGKPFNGGVSIITDQPTGNRNLGMNHDITQCNGVANISDVTYIPCRLPSLNLATATYGVNHTLNASEGIVKASASGITFTLPHALAGQTWQIVNPTSGTITLAIDSGTLSGNGATGSITISANSGGIASCDGTNCNALGFGGGGSGGCSPGGTTNALQYNGGGPCSFGGVNSPTANGNYNVHYRVTASAAVPPAIDPSGIPINVQTGTTYTIGTANTDFDRGYVITANNAGAQTYTFVNPSTAGYGFNHYFIIKNIGTGTVTVTASGFTINGAASLLIPPSWTVFFWSDGVNYFASRLPDFTAFPNCVGGGNALQFTTATGIFSCGASSAGVASITGDGIVISNSASTGAVTLTLANAAAHKFLMNNTAGSAAPGYQSPGKADLLGTIVYNDQANVIGAFNQDFSLATWKIPTGAGFTASATSMFGYDTTNKNPHCYDNNADAICAGFVSAPTTGDCIKATVTSGNVLLADGGGLNCGIQNTTTTNPTTAVAGNTCGTATTLTMTGVTSTMIPLFGAPSDITASTGWGSTGGLVIVAWFTANTLNYKICNQTASSITPGAVAWNVGAR